MRVRTIPGDGSAAAHRDTRRSSSRTAGSLARGGLRGAVLAVALGAASGFAQVPPPPTTSLPPPPPVGWQVDVQAGVLPAQVIEVQRAYEAPAEGQWVLTSQHGWVWMPHAQPYTRVTSAGDAYHFVYSVPHGWRWVAAPWILGLGPAPQWGAPGVVRFAWHARPWFSRPWGRPAHGRVIAYSTYEAAPPPPVGLGWSTPPRGWHDSTHRARPVGAPAWGHGAGERGRGHRGHSGW